MKVIKKIICISLGFMLLSGISGCVFDKAKKKTPTEVVSQSLDYIKSGDSENIQGMLSENLPINIKGNSGLKELLPESSEKLEDALKNITYKVNSENINGNKAVVNVTVNGPDLKEPFDMMISDVVKDIKSGELRITKFDIDKVSKKYDSSFSDLIKNVKTTERTGNIELEKKHGKWVVNMDDLSKLSININPDDYDDKYELSSDDIHKLLDK